MGKSNLKKIEYNHKDLDKVSIDFTISGHLAATLMNFVKYLSDNDLIVPLLCESKEGHIDMKVVDEYESMKDLSKLVSDVSDALHDAEKQA